MAHLPKTHQNLTIHLSDRLLNPLISSARSPIDSTKSASAPESQHQSQTQSTALSSLTTSALTAYDAAARLELGLPQRVMIETSKGPLVLHSFLNTKSNSDHELGETGVSDGDIASISQGVDEVRLLERTPEQSYLEDRGRTNVSEGPTNGVRDNRYDRSDEGEVEREASKTKHAPLLIATVVAPTVEELGDARRAAGGLEKMGREFQREWAKEEVEGKGMERGNG